MIVVVVIVVGCNKRYSIATTHVLRFAFFFFLNLL
jgi:hypothetical protein